MKMIFLVFLFLFLSSIIFGQGPTYNEEFQVNSYVINNQIRPSVSGLYNKGFIVCWESNGQEGFLEKVIAQRFDTNGVKLGGEIQVSSYSNDIQLTPDVSALTNNSYVICWESYANESDHYGIYAQMYDENGVKIGNEFRVNSYRDGWQRFPQVCELSNGGFIINWSSDEQDSSGYGIYAQMYDENGIKIGNEFRVNTFTDGNQFSGAITSLDNGNFIICWVSYQQDGSEYGIYAQMYDENGIKIGNEFRVNSSTNNWQISPSIAGLSNNKYIICWASLHNIENGYDIYAQLFSENGIKLGEEFLVNSFILDSQNSPEISSLSNNRFIISWASYAQDGDKSGIFAQLFDSNCVRIGTEFLVNHYTEYDQSRPSNSNLINNKLVICWDSYWQDGDNGGVFGKYYFSNPIDHNLISLNLLFPQTKSTINHNNPRFIWQQASDVHINFPWELTYDLYIDENINFINPTIYEGIQDTTILPDTLTNGQTYYWKVLARTYSGDSLWCSDVYNFYVDPNAVTGIKDIDEPLPEIFILHQNYPNPFNPTTKIKFSIPLIVGNEDFQSLLKVYDVLGNEITTLVNEQKPPGTYEVEFSADDFSLTSGIYFYKLTVGQFSDTRKMLLIK